MSAGQNSQQWYKDLERQNMERIRAEVSGCDFNQIIQYFKRLREEEERAQRLFTPGEPMEISNLLLSDSPQEIVAHCKTCAEKYEALKDLARNHFFPHFPIPFNAPHPQDNKLYEVGLELFKDLLSEQPGPTKKRGRPAEKRVTSRNARIKRYFRILSEVTDLPKGTNSDGKYSESCVEVLAKVFCLTPSSIRDALKP